MKKIFFISILILTVFSSCNLFTGKRGKIAITAMEAIQENRIDETVQYFDMKYDPKVNSDSFKLGLRFFRNNLLSSFGTGLIFTYVQTVPEGVMNNVKSKDFATSFVQFENAKYFGYVRVVFLKKTDKIVNINIHDTISTKPDMSRFWYHLAAPILIVIFNLYVLFLLYKSKIKLKWIAMLVVVLFNFPALQFTALGQYQIVLRDEFLMGFGLNMAGYEYSTIAAGVPLGGLIMLAFLSFRKK
ncbi:MAG: hypothetical protein V2A54_04610 [Bacteroidota bacterium]